MPKFPGGAEKGDGFTATTEITTGCAFCPEGCRLRVDGQAGMAAVAILSAWDIGTDGEPVIVQIPSITVESIDHPNMSVPRVSRLSIGADAGEGLELDCADNCAYAGVLPDVKNGLIEIITGTGLRVEEVPNI